MRIRSKVPPVCLALVFSMALARPGAAADDEKVLARIVDLNRQALAAHAAGKGVAAKEKLLDAAVLGKESGLGTHAALARTYLHLGIVHVDALNDRDKALRYFESALKVRPDIDLTASVATKGAEGVFAQARAAMGIAPRPAAAVAPAHAAAEREREQKQNDKERVAQEKQQALARGREEKPLALRKATERKRLLAGPPLPARFSGPLFCPPIGEAEAGADLYVRCVLRPGLAPAKVALHFRPQGVLQFQAIPMRRTARGWYTAVVPSTEVTGPTLQYYVEARNGLDRVVGNDGRRELPNVVSVRRTPAPASSSVSSSAPRTDGEPGSLSRAAHRPAAAQRP